jgi:hypothetical protein
MTKLCARGKSAAKRKFKVYPSAYANAYASKICAGKAKDPSGLKRKDWGPKKANEGVMVNTPRTKNQKLIKVKTKKTKEQLKLEAQKIIDNFPKEKIYNYKKPKKKPYTIVKPSRAMMLDTTTNISGAAVPLQKMCGGEVRGTGAAIRGKGFKGVF